MGNIFSGVTGEIFNNNDNGNVNDNNDNDNNVNDNNDILILLGDFGNTI